MMKVSLAFATKVIESIDSVVEKTNDKLLVFELKKAKEMILKSIEIARPMISDNDEENKWILHAETLPFDGIERGRLLNGLSSIKPDILRWLLLITKD